MNEIGFLRLLFDRILEVKLKKNLFDFNLAGVLVVFDEGEGIMNFLVPSRGEGGGVEFNTSIASQR